MIRLAVLCMLLAGPALAATSPAEMLPDAALSKEGDNAYVWRVKGGTLSKVKVTLGERDPRTLAALRNYRCQKDLDEIARALTGTWREEHLFVLQQALALFDFYTTQLSECDAQIELAFSVITPRFEAAPEESPALQERR